jgi:hypothetical protein
MHPAYMNIAIILTGLFVGAASQGLAYVMVWDDDAMCNMSTLHRDLLCWLWAAWTIASNMLAGYAMICQQAPRSSENRIHCQQQRTTMQLEILFIASCIVGILPFWIGHDALDNKMEQVMSILIMLCLYMIGIATILICVPQESYVEVPASEEDETESYVPPPLLLVAVQTVK